MNLPASQPAGKFLRFPQPLDTLPIRAEDLCVNLSLARRQAPQRLTNGERGALDYQPGSSIRRYRGTYAALIRLTRTVVSLPLFPGWALAHPSTYYSMSAAYQASAADPEGPSRD